MSIFKTILLATDFSESSGPAAEKAIELAALAGAQLHILHVIGELDEHQRVMIPAEAFETLQREVETQVVRELDAICKQVPGNIQTTTHTPIGNPFQIILQVAKDINADLIVMGTHGKTGIEHVLVGSTAERVVRRSEIPVLTVRA